KRARAAGRPRALGAVHGMTFARERLVPPRYRGYEMNRHDKRLSDPELIALFDQLFPEGLAGPDVIAEIAPAGWERSPLIACFHPSVYGSSEEQRQSHRNVEELDKLRRRRDSPPEGSGAAASAAASDNEPQDEPTLESGRREHQPQPVRQSEEVT